MTKTDTSGFLGSQSSDALGRLTQVIEYPGDAPAITTNYLYDALDNLTGVCQGGSFDAGGNCIGGRGGSSGTIR